jgi:hypothetical protein
MNTLGSRSVQAETWYIFGVTEAIEWSGYSIKEILERENLFIELCAKIYTL